MSLKSLFVDILQLQNWNLTLPPLESQHSGVFNGAKVLILTFDAQNGGEPNSHFNGGQFNTLPSDFEIQPKIGSYRLPDYRRDAHRKFFP